MRVGSATTTAVWVSRETSYDLTPVEKYVSNESLSVFFHRVFEWRGCLSLAACDKGTLITRLGMQEEQVVDLRGRIEEDEGWARR